MVERVLPSRAVRALSLVEVLMAVVFLAVGALVVYSAVMHGVTTSAWSAERVFVEGLLRDLASTYETFSYCQFVKQKPQDNVDRWLPLMPVSLLDTLRNPPSEAECLKDPFYREYVETLKLLEVKRKVTVSAVSPEVLAVTCEVEWRSRLGGVQTSRRRFVKFGSPFNPCR